MRKKILEEAMISHNEDVSANFFSDVKDDQQNRSKPKKRKTPSVRKSGTENKSATIVTVPLTSRQKEELGYMANALNTTMAEVMRLSLEEYIDRHLKVAVQQQLQEVEDRLKGMAE